MNCPDCGHPFSSVLNSRRNPTGLSVYRRRECLDCGHRWSTREVEVKEQKRALKKEDAIAALNKIQDILLSTDRD